MAKRYSGISFPVLRSVEILNYQLFPGIGQQGLIHHFEPGVSVVIGVNGIGKTTFLNALLRLLIGPFDAPRENPDEVGATKHALVDWRTPNYFRDRVPDLAVEATIAGKISFGSDEIRIKRKLKDLSVVSLSLNSEEYSFDAETKSKPSKSLEQHYQEIVTKLSGVSNFYDFRFLIRNLLFYLEDRRPLIWADQGQFEIARILFIKPSTSEAFADITDQIKQIDSEYRGLRYEYGRKHKRLTELENLQRSVNSEQENPATLAAALSGAEDLLVQLETELSTKTEREQTLAENIRNTQIDLEAASRAYEAMQQSFYIRAFPKAAATFHYTIAHLVSESGCLVCGSQAENVAKKLKEDIEHGICPICHSPPDAQEGGSVNVSVPAQIAAATVNKARDKALLLRNSLEQLQEDRATIATTISDLTLRHLRTELERNRLKERYQILSDATDGQPRAIRELKAAIEIDKEELDRLDKKREEASKKFSQLFDATKANLDQAFEATKKYFEGYITGFITERCTLDVSTKSEPLGQGGPPVPQPRLRVSMRSSTHDTFVPRSNKSQVSESQAEFLDLAFRMALIRAAAEKGRAMLVIETPEASLDTLFVYSAGDVLRKFAAEEGADGDVVIASSNLNETPMIPALLGIDRQTLLPEDWKERWTINLLAIATRTAALEKNFTEYMKRYERATTPDPTRAIQAPQEPAR